MDIKVRDSNGAQLAEGDSVTLIKDLKLKGSSTVLKRGTVIRNIHLTDDADEIEGRTDKVKGLVLRTEFLKKVCDAASGISFAITAAQPDAAADFVVDHDRKAADKNRELALEAPLNAERLVAGKRRTVRHLIEQMGRALVPGGGKSLVPGDLRSGHPAGGHSRRRRLRKNREPR